MFAHAGKPWPDGDVGEVKRLPVPTEERLVIAAERLVSANDRRQVPKYVAVGQIADLLKERFAAVVGQQEKVAVERLVEPGAGVGGVLWVGEAVGPAVSTRATFVTG